MNGSCDYNEMAYVIIKAQEGKIKQLEAELAQLQADNEAMKKTVDEIAALNEKMNDEAIKLQEEKEALRKQIVQLKDEAVGVDVAFRQYKGALRTLANQLVENEIVPPMYDPEYENKSWADCWIFQALANPTEEQS